MKCFDVDEGGPYDGNTPPGELPPEAKAATKATAEWVVQAHPHKCPCCDGTGLVSRPPGVAGDVPSWTSTGTPAYPCRACTGTGVLWR